MAKVIIIGKNFLAPHPKKGTPTYFLERVLVNLGTEKVITDNLEWLNIDSQFPVLPKRHTLRNGKKWKTGDIASIRVWSARPFHSAQIIVSKDLPVRVFDIEMCIKDRFLVIGDVNHFHTFEKTIEKLATNDGLYIDDFKSWFGDAHFSGQVVCWDESVKY
jgi:hypothetical protein